MIMLTTTFGLLLSAQAATSRDMLNKCPEGFDTWQDVSTNQWNFDEDYEDQIADGATLYPAGFRPYVLGIYNEPPVCMFVTQSKDKKVEILVESPMENVNLCISDAAYNGVNMNDVGSVAVCGTGKIYACFTSAMAENLDENNNQENFGFYVWCSEGCEDMEIDLWIRVRKSNGSWDDGKTDVTDDLEHWCEGERGATFTDGNGQEQMYYTYPSDLVPDEPSSYPFHINQIFGRNAGSQTQPRIWLVSGLVAVALILGLFA